MCSTREWPSTRSVSWKIPAWTAEFKTVWDLVLHLGHIFPLYFPICSFSLYISSSILNWHASNNISCVLTFYSVEKNLYGQY